MVAVDNCGVGPITVSAVADNKVEDQGTEVFLLSIAEDAAYIVGNPPIATVYVKGTFLIMTLFAEYFLLIILLI